MIPAMCADGDFFFVAIVYCVAVVASSILLLSVVRSFCGGRCVELAI
jgi:hypothetical protein